MPGMLHILFVCMAPSEIEVLSKLLRKGGLEVAADRLDDPQRLPAMLDHGFQLLLVDSLTSHPQLIENIHTVLAEKSLDIPVLVYSSQGDRELIIAAMKAGAKDFITSQNPQRILPSVRRELAAVQQRTEFRRQVQIDAMLQEIDGLMLQGWDVTAIAARICQQTMILCELCLAWIGGKQADGTVGIVASAGDTDYLQKIDVRWDAGLLASGPIGIAISKKQSVVARTDAPAFAPWRKLAEQHGIRSVLALPLVVRGEIIGVLGMYSTRPDAFDVANVGRYTMFANRLAMTLMMAQEHHQFRLLSAAMDTATQAIYITTCDGKIIWFNRALSVISGYAPHEIMDHTPHLFCSGTHEKSFWQAMWRDITDGKLWAGEVLNRRKDGSLYSVLQNITPLYDGQGTISHFLCLQQDISEKKELESKIEYMAYHDILTGLPNRSLFNDRVNQAINQARRDRTALSLLFVDLDGFKQVNDIYGHAAGDQLLQMVAERLRSCVRQGDTVARLGGDEFIVLLRDVATYQGLMNVTQKIIERIAHRYELEGGVANVTASIGISRYPQDAVSAEQLLNCADEAMYAAKRAGKNRCVMSDKSVPLDASLDWQI